MRRPPTDVRNGPRYRRGRGTRLPHRADRARRGRRTSPSRTVTAPDHVVDVRLPRGRGTRATLVHHSSTAGSGGTRTTAPTPARSPRPWPTHGLRGGDPGVPPGRAARWPVGWPDHVRRRAVGGPPGTGARGRPHRPRGRPRGAGRALGRRPPGAVGGRGSRTPPPVPGVVALAPVADLRRAYDLDLDGGAVAALLGGGPDEVPDRYAGADPMARLPIGGTGSTLVHGDRDARCRSTLSRRYRRGGPGGRRRRCLQGFAGCRPLPGY